MRSGWLFGMAAGLGVAVGAATPAAAANEFRGPDDDWVAYFDASRSEHQSRVSELGDSHRLISLNLSASPASPRFAAVWVRGQSDQIITAAACCTRGEMLTLFDSHGPPIIATATGPNRASATYAAVWESGHDGLSVRFGLDTTEFIAQKGIQLAANRMLRWASPFGSTAEPLYTAVWERVRNKGTPSDLAGFPVWTSTLGRSLGEWQDDWNAQKQQWVRPGVLAPAPNGSFVTAWYDSLLGEGNAYPALSAFELAGQIAAHYPDQLPMQIQASGASGEAIYSVLFAEADRLVAHPDQRVGGIPRNFEMWPRAASPAFAGFDAAVRREMKDGGLRAVSVAVAYRGRLVYARAYTWAETDGGYPVTTTDRFFRIGSISKVFTAVGGFMLEQGHPGILDTTLLEALDQEAEPDLTSLVRLSHLLAHTSGFTRKTTDPAVVSRSVNGGDLVLPITHAQNQTYHLANVGPDFGPGADVQYSNLGYFLVGEALGNLRGLSYRDFAHQVVFPPLYYDEPRRPYLARSRKEDQFPKDVRFHTSSLVPVASVMDVGPDGLQPLVPSQYGSQHLALSGASGGWSATAPQVAKLLGVFTLPFGLSGPLEGATVEEMLSPVETPRLGTLWTNTKGGFKRMTRQDRIACDVPDPEETLVYNKAGAVSGARSNSIVRTDGVVVVVLTNGSLSSKVTECELNQWVKGVDWSAFGGVDLFLQEGIPRFNRISP